MRASLSLIVALLAMSMFAGCAEERRESMGPEDDSGLEEICSYEGETYASGDVVHKSSSVSCICEEDGTLGRCTGLKPDTDGGEMEDEASCTFEGSDYAVGDVIPKSTGVSCLCLAGGEIGACTGALPE